MLEHRICKNCGKEFKVYVTPADIKRGFGRGTYCSRKCRSEWLSKNRSGAKSKLWKDKVKRICETCGKEFLEWPYIVKRGGGRYCSRDCWRVSRGKPPEKRICETCGKEFDYYANKSNSNKGSTGKYCSQECYQKRRNQPVKCICDNCGKEFYRQASLYRINNKRGTTKLYCSNDCKGNAWKGENNPNDAGGTSNWPYCELFKTVIPRVLIFFDDKCFLCEKTKKENGFISRKTKRVTERELCVHHVTYDKLACCHIDNISKLYKLTGNQLKAIELADKPTRKLIEIYGLTPDRVKEIEEDRIRDNALMDEFGVPAEYRWMFVPLCHSCHGKTNSKKKRNYWKRYFIAELMKRTGGQSYVRKEIQIAQEQN